PAPLEFFPAALQLYFVAPSSTFNGASIDDRLAPHNRRRADFAVGKNSSGAGRCEAPSTQLAGGMSFPRGVQFNPLGRTLTLTLSRKRHGRGNPVSSPPSFGGED